MVKQVVQWVFWQWVKWRDWVMKKTDTTVKIITSILLLITSFIFLADQYHWWILPEFHKFSTFDAWFWAWFMATQAAAQLWLLRCSGCLKCKIWSDFALQIAGLSLVVIGGMFIAKYPPFRMHMAIFPILGFAVAWAGRSLNKRSRQKLKEDCSHDVC